MFDIGWPELTIILIVALLVIGPRDLPRAMHTVGRWVRKARAVTGEFQRHVDDMVREADMEDLRELKKLGKFNKHSVAKELGKAIDPTGEIREKTDIRDRGAATKAAAAPAKENGAGGAPPLHKPEAEHRAALKPEKPAPQGPMSVQPETVEKVPGRAPEPAPPVADRESPPPAADRGS